MCYFLIINGVLRWVRECVDFSGYFGNLKVFFGIMKSVKMVKSQKNQWSTEHSTELILPKSSWFVSRIDRAFSPAKDLSQNVNLPPLIKDTVVWHVSSYEYHIFATLHLYWLSIYNDHMLLWIIILIIYGNDKVFDNCLFTIDTINLSTY